MRVALRHGIPSMERSKRMGKEWRKNEEWIETSQDVPLVFRNISISDCEAPRSRCQERNSDYRKALTPVVQSGQSVLVLISQNFFSSKDTKSGPTAVSLSQSWLAEWAARLLLVRRWSNAAAAFSPGRKMGRGSGSNWEPSIDRRSPLPAASTASWSWSLCIQYTISLFGS